MLGVRWSHALVLHFNGFLLHIGSYKQYGIVIFPFSD